MERQLDEARAFAAKLDRIISADGGEAVAAAGVPPPPRR